LFVCFSFSLCHAAARWLAGGGAEGRPGTCCAYECADGAWIIGCPVDLGWLSAVVRRGCHDDVWPSEGVVHDEPEDGVALVFFFLFFFSYSPERCWGCAPRVRPEEVWPVCLACLGRDEGGCARDGRGYVLFRRTCVSLCVSVYSPHQPYRYGNRGSQSMMAVCRLVQYRSATTAARARTQSPARTACRTAAVASATRAGPTHPAASGGPFTRAAAALFQARTVILAPQLRDLGGRAGRLESLPLFHQRQQQCPIRRRAGCPLGRAMPMQFQLSADRQRGRPMYKIVYMYVGRGSGRPKCRGYAGRTR
jgi:hypothetical protein